MKHLQLLTLVASALIIFAWSPSTARADENDDLFEAQVCLDSLARSGGDHHQALRCIERIQGYQDSRANGRKCVGYWAYGGFGFFTFPWFLDQSIDYPLILLLNHIFDVEVTKNFAWTIMTTCRNSELAKQVVFLGDFLWLKAVLLEVSPLKENTLITDLAGLNDEAKIDEIESALQTVIGDCNAAPTNAILPLKNTLFCLELKRIEEAPGARLYDRLIYRLRVYG
jgi:hypothetical protein